MHKYLIMAPCIIMYTGFAITPYSQIQNMTKLVLAAGEEAVFQCQYCATDSEDDPTQYCTAEDILSWSIDGEILNELNLPKNIMVVRRYDIRPYCGALFELIINNISHYNLSTIQCSLEAGISDEVSEPVTLWVQGIYV